MQFQFHPYSLPLLLSAILSGAISATAWNRRGSPGAIPLAINMLALCIWSLTYAMMWLSAGMSAQIFWLNATYLGVVAAPLSFLVLTAEITQENWITKRTLPLLALVPLTTFILVWTNTFHHLFHASFTFRTVNGLAYLSWSRGPWFWINATYSYALIIMGVVLLMRAIITRAASVFRVQLTTILVGALAPVIASLLTQLWFKQISDLDLAPIAFSVSGIFFAQAIFGQGFLEILPIARSVLVENMSDGLIVLDEKYRILDINQSAENMLKVKARNMIGKDGRRLHPEWEELIEIVHKTGGENHTRMAADLDSARHLDVTIKKLRVNRNQSQGYLIVFRDVTEYWEAENELRLKNEQLAHQLREITLLKNALREQAIHDSLTGVYNRRFLDETLAAEIERAKAGNHPLCIIMVDLDNFKDVNDVFGHKAGDIVLRGLAEQIRRITRNNDFACRYGGDEFVIILPNIPLEAAARRAEQVRLAFEGFRMPFKKFELHTTASLGVALYPLHGTSPDLLLRAADKALYASKAAGRNRVTIFDPKSDMNTNPQTPYRNL